MIRHYFLTTIRTLRQNPLYTALSVFGIALTFVFVCVLFLIVKATKGDYIPPKYAERTWTIFQVDHGNGRNRWITKEQCETWIPKMKTPEMILVTTYRMEETAVINNQSMALSVLGVGDHYFDIHRLKFLRGRPINRQEIADAIPVTILDRYIANLYFGQNEDPIGKDFELNGIQYRVVGIVETTSLFNYDDGLAFANMWIPFGASRRVSGNMWCKISFTAKDAASIADMQAEFTRVINEAHTEEDVQYSIPNRQKRSLDKSGIADIRFMFSIIGSLILMLIPALNILSLNISKSYERSEEIAVRKAFGAPLRTVFGQLFFENTLLTLAGATIGMCITPPLMHSIDRMMLNISIMPLPLSLQFDWMTILLVAVPCVLAFSFLSGSIPAWIIAKKEIVNVLKGEAK